MAKKGPKKSTVRDAMHEVTSCRIDDADDIEAALDPFGQQPELEMDDIVASLRDMLKTTLMRDGYPDPFSACLVTDDTWRPLPDGWQEMTNADRRRNMGAGTALTIGWNYIEKSSEPLSPALMAAKLAFLVWRYDGLPQGKRPLQAYLIGNLSAKIQSRRHLRSVTRGKTTQRAAALGGTARRNALAGQRTEILDAMEQLFAKGHSIANAARIVYKDGRGTSPGANTKLWQRRTGKKAGRE